MLQMIREKLKKISPKQVVSVIFGMIPTVIFVVFIYYMMIHTFTGTVKDTVKDTELSFDGFETLSNSFEDVLEDNFYDKNEFINLNGLTTRALGIHTLNERQLLTNGHLDYIGNINYSEKYSTNVIELNDFLNDRNIDFVYVLAPTKRAFYDSTFAPGYSSNAKESYDTMIEVLDESGVITVDMNSWFEENEWTMDDVYYKTDHHWKTQAGLAASRVTMDILSTEGLVDYDPYLLDDDSWEITVYEDWFLGSHGKRTGTTYAGVDDIVLYQPKFATDYSYAYIRSGTTTWNYADTILNLDYLDEPDYFNENPCIVYMRGDYPNRITINNEAPNNQRILLMGDSFKMPFEYFMTTQFQEVYTIDLRYCTDGATLVQYVEEFQPDIVIMCSNSIALNDLYTFGTSEYLDALNETDPNALVISLGDFIVEADEDSKNVFTVVCSNLEPGQTYTLTLDSTSYYGGDGHHIQMTLQDISSNKAIVNRYFDADSDDEQKWIFSVPESADTYVIYLYAGTKGTTANVSVEVSNVKLREGIFEE